MPDQGAHFQDKTQAITKVHCLGNTLTFQKVSFNFFVLTRMPPDLESLQMLLFKNHCPETSACVWHLLTCKPIEKTEMGRL